MSLRDDLARMEDEDKAATPGPWDEDGIERMLRLHDQPTGNGAFIASVRTDRPALCELVKMLVADIDSPDDIAQEHIEQLWAEAKRRTSP